MYASELIESLKGQNRMIKANIRAEKNRIKVMKRLHAQKIRLQTQWEKVASKASECANELTR